MPDKLFFASDYMEGAHPAIMKRLAETNMEHTAGYGLDEYPERAREKIRDATVIDALLRPWQGVVAAETGHIAVHEAGAIEFGGHKVLTLPQRDGKLCAETIARCVETYQKDDNRAHTVMPGMVYISQPTEYGTLYALEELEALSAVCRGAGLPLYLDGARLAYALATPVNDAGLADIARLCDAFYIGGTKCGALLGEAVVFPKPAIAPHFFTIVKQHGALLAKGRVVGIQFDTLFTDGLYGEVGRNAIDAANRIRAALDAKGYAQPFVAPTNQIFVALSPERAKALSRRVEMGFWENLEDGRTVMRIATSWATDPEDVDRLIELL